MENDINNINNKLDNIFSRIKTIEKILTISYIVNAITLSMVLYLILSN